MGWQVRTLPEHTNDVTSVAVSADGKHIVSGSYDMTVQIRDAETGTEVRGVVCMGGACMERGEGVWGGSLRFGTTTTQWFAHCPMFSPAFQFLAGASIAGLQGMQWLCFRTLLVVGSGCREFRGCGVV